MALIATRYFASLLLGFVALLFLSAAVDLHFNVSHWQEEVIARQTILKGVFERAGRYTEAFRAEHHRLPDEGELRAWAKTQSLPTETRLMTSNLRVAPAGEGCFLGDEAIFRTYSLCYFNGEPFDWKWAPQTGENNLRLRPFDFRPSLDYSAQALAMVLIPLLLAFWVWPKTHFRRSVRNLP
jgi:hypothetical protein